MLTKQAASDYGGDNIRCNVACPGFVYSDMVAEHFGPIAEELGTDLRTLMTKVFQDISSRKPAQPEQIAKASAVFWPVTIHPILPVSLFPLTVGWPLWILSRCALKTPALR